MTVPIEPHHPPTNRRIPFLIIIGLFGLAFGFLINVLDPLLYSEKVSVLAPPAIKNSALSFVTISALLVAFVTQPLMGRWSDMTRSRWGRRAPYLVGGVMALSVSVALVVAADTLWLLIVAAMLTAGSSNTVQGVWQALIPDHVPKSQRGTAVGIKTLLELIGVVGGVAVAGFTLARGDLWTAPLTALFLFWMILLITLILIRKAGSLQNNPSVSASKSLLTHPARIIAYIRAVPGFSWWIVNRFLFWSAAIAVRTFILNYMEDVLQIPHSQAQLVSSRIFIMLGIGVFLLALPAGALADRIGRRPILIVAGILAASGTALLTITHDLTMLFVAGGLIAIGAGIFVSSSWASATDLAPPAQAALYLGLANSASVTGSIGGRLGGPLIDGVNQLSGTMTLGYLVVYAIATVFFLGSSLVALKIPDKK